LMSDVLRGQIPELEEEIQTQIEDMSSKFVSVVAHVKDNTHRPRAFTGMLRSVLFEVEPEIEIRVELSLALDIVEAAGLVFERFELHHGDRMVPMAGPYVPKAARIQDIDVADQLCTIALGLKKLQR